MSPQLVAQPKGTVLVIGTWNFPLSLSLEPVVGAIAAGCTVVVEPSEIAPATTALIANLALKYLDSSAVKVINGGIEETTELLKLQWDHIFYTGSANVGRVVARAAAEHLTPCTLELGGKSPVVVLDDVDLARAATRILWGKHLNAGQICVSADYVLCTAATQPKLVGALRTTLEAYDEVDKDGKRIPAIESDGYSKIGHQRHFDRLEKMLADTKGRVVIDGGINKDTLKIGLTVVADVKPDDALMKGKQAQTPALAEVHIADVGRLVPRRRDLWTHLAHRRRCG